MAFWDKEYRREFCMFSALVVAVVGFSVAGLSLSHNLGYWPYGNSPPTPQSQSSNQNNNPAPTPEGNFMQWLIFALINGSVLAVGVLYYLGRRHGTSSPLTGEFSEGKPKWQKLQWANSERERLEKELEQLKAAQSAPSAPPKLTIHRAVYGGGPLAETLVTDQLQNAVREALIISVDSTLGGLIDDPARNVQKHLEVEYSFGSNRKIHAYRMEASPGEITRLVLPEDTEIQKLRGQLELFKVAQPKPHPAFIFVNVTSLRAEETTISRGRTLKIRYEIVSSEDVSEGVWLGASLGDGKGKYFSNARQDKPITLLKGPHEYDRDLTIPVDVLPGRYKLGANVWYGVLANGSKSVIIAPGSPVEIVVVA